MKLKQLCDGERLDWLRLINCENVGPVTFMKLLRRFGSAGEALQQLPEMSLRGGSRRPLRIWSKEIAEQALDYTDEIGARFVALPDPQYPQLLRHTDGAPPLLCIKGNARLLNETSIGIVGSRNASAVGMNFARTLASDLASHNIATVSGLARGIDTAAHQASVKTGTIAVVAGGVDIMYPPENSQLQKDIYENGIVVSEMMPGTRPQARHFPRRNRLIAGISCGTVVVEAALRSGSLITARLAGEQNREVFAVPGSPLDPRAGGTNKLIKDGATLVSSASDIVAVVRGIERLQSPLQPSFFEDGNEEVYDVPDDQTSTEIHQRVTSLLSPAPTSIDDLLRETGASIDVIQTVLLELELAGRLQRHTGQRVSLV